MRILIIEDNRTMARIIERGLENEGYSDYVLVESAEEAFDALLDRSFDLFLVDWMLPGVSGLDFARLLLNSDTYGNKPIIITTAKDHSDDVREALQVGVDGYIVKPIDFGAFQTKLRKVMQRYPNIPEPPAVDRSTARRVLQSIRGVLWTAPESLDRLLAATPPDGALCGYKVADLLRRPQHWFAQMHDEDAEHFREALGKLSAGEAHAERYRWRDPNDTIRWVDTYACRFKSGKKAYFSGFSVEVTNRVRDEAALRDRVDELEHLNEALQINNEYLQTSVNELQRALDDGTVAEK
jgi:CheY-like chemotaxis protein